MRYTFWNHVLRYLKVKVSDIQLEGSTTEWKYIVSNCQDDFNRLLSTKKIYYQFHNDIGNNNKTKEERKKQRAETMEAKIVNGMQVNDCLAWSTLFTKEYHGRLVHIEDVSTKPKPTRHLSLKVMGCSVPTGHCYHALHIEIEKIWWRINVRDRNLDILVDGETIDAIIKLTEMDCFAKLSLPPTRMR